MDEPRDDGTDDEQPTPVPRQTPEPPDVRPDEGDGADAALDDSLVDGLDQRPPPDPTED